MIYPRSNSVVCEFLKISSVLFSLSFACSFYVLFSLIVCICTMWGKLKLNSKALFAVKVLNASFLPSHQGSCSMLTSPWCLFLSLSVHNSHTAWWMASTNEISKNADMKFHFSVHWELRTRSFEPAIVGFLLKCTHSTSFVLNSSTQSASAFPFFKIVSVQWLT